MSALTNATRFTVGLLVAAGLLQACVDPDGALRAEPDTVCSPDATAKLDVPEYQP